MNSVGSSGFILKVPPGTAGQRTTGGNQQKMGRWIFFVVVGEIEQKVHFGGIFRWNSQVEITTRELFSLSPAKNTFLNTAQKVWDTLAFSIYISYDEDTTNILKPKAISSISTSRTTITFILCWSVILELYHLMSLSPIPYGIVTLQHPLLVLGQDCENGWGTRKRKIGAGTLHPLPDTKKDLTDWIIIVGECRWVPCFDPRSCHEYYSWWGIHDNLRSHTHP